MINFLRKYYIFVQKYFLAILYFRNPQVNDPTVSFLNGRSTTVMSKKVEKMTNLRSILHVQNITLQLLHVPETQFYEKWNGDIKHIL